MKKIFAASMLLLVAALLLPTLVHAEETCEKEIARQVVALEKVKDAKCVVYQNCALVAFRPENVQSKTEMRQLTDKIRQIVRENLPDAEKIFVTANVRIFREAEKIAETSGEERQKAIDEILERLSKVPMPIK